MHDESVAYYFKMNTDLSHLFFSSIKPETEPQDCLQVQNGLLLLLVRSQRMTQNFCDCERLLLCHF